MDVFNVEIKAKHDNSENLKFLLERAEAYFEGQVHQLDTYFKVANGRLKLREFGDDATLVHYERTNQAGPKGSDVILYHHKVDSSLKAALSKSLDVLVVVDKLRDVYRIDNVKFHIDEVKNLGSFVEIEAQSFEGNIDERKLWGQCEFYLDFLDINRADLIECSYSDLLPNKNH